MDPAEGGEHEEVPDELSPGANIASGGGGSVEPNEPA